MASASFRDSMNSLGWSRRDSDVPVNTSSPSLLGRIQNINPFGSGGYVRLPTTNDGPGAPLPAPTRREEEEGWFARKSPFVLCGELIFNVLFSLPPMQPLRLANPFHNIFQGIRAAHQSLFSFCAILRPL
jgi:hypothetical protein